MSTTTKNKFEGVVPSLENVHTQLDGMFFKELTVCMKTLRETIGENKKENNDSLNALKNITDCIKRYTNLNIKAHIDWSVFGSINAFIIPPSIDMNHPFVQKWRSYFLNNNEGRSTIRWGGNGIQGNINLKTGKAEGFYTKLDANYYLTKELVLSKDFTDDEIAAITLHEVGHYITYLVTLGQLDDTCYTLTETVRVALGNQDKESRVKLIESIEKNAKVKITDRDTVINSTNGDVIAVAVMTDLVYNRRSEFGSVIYDERSWESLSDNYASRMGAAVSLTRALGKLLNKGWDRSTRNVFSFYLFEVAKMYFWIMQIASAVVISVVGFPLGTIIGVLNLMTIYAILTQNPFSNDYDEGKARITRIKRDVTFQLKDPRLTKEQKLKLLDDHKVIVGIEKQFNDRETFNEKFWTIISPWTRQQKNLMKELRQLEAITNNDVMVAATRLSTIKPS